MKKKNQFLVWGLVVGWMIFIFLCSTMKGSMSGNITRRILEVLFQRSVTSREHYYFRKWIHVMVSYILFFLLFMAFREAKKDSLKKYFLPLCICVIYMFFDEIHQLFVSGRYGSMKDVLIDSFGSFLSMILCKISDIFMKGKV